nr:MAG TPA: hypothetical protein [Bacteriophage sp.]
MLYFSTHQISLPFKQKRSEIVVNTKPLLLNIYSIYFICFFIK